MSKLANLKVPGPTTIPLTEPFWTAAAEGMLSLQHCRACERSVFYPREICPHCWSADLQWKRASGRGQLRSFSVVEKPGHFGWLPAAPYVVALVRLAEGPTMLSLVVDPPSDLRAGTSLTLLPTNIGGRVLPAFTVDTQGEPS